MKEWDHFHKFMELYRDFLYFSGHDEYVDIEHIEHTMSGDIPRGTFMKMDDLVNKWKNLPLNCSEGTLNSHFFNDFLHFLEFPFAPTPTISGGIVPDFMLYDKNNEPILIVENKRRTSTLATCPKDDADPNDQRFIKACLNNSLYRDAVGYGTSGNGIRQYLKVQTNPARYGLVFNGDFFQLFRKVDEIIVPLTDIKRVTAETLPGLIAQLKFYLNELPKAFTVSLWNRKGGVAKTTNTINIAAVLAERGKRVLVVDLDPQVDLTKGLGLNPENFKGKLLGCLTELDLGNKESVKKILTEEIIQQRSFTLPNNQGACSIAVFPGHRETLEKFGDQSKDTGFQMRGKSTAVKRLLSFIAQDYDYILIDASPKADTLTACSLFAADGVIIPSDYDPETLRHASDISQHLIPGKIRPARKAAKSKKSLAEEVGPHILGLVFSNCSDIGITLKKKIDEHLQNKVHIKVYKTELRRYDMVPVAKFARIPVVFHRPKSPITAMYKKLVDEVFFEHNFVDFNSVDPN
jgi:chromosome partitioning protein